MFPPVAQLHVRKNFIYFSFVIMFQFCNKRGEVSESITVETILHTSASIMTYHYLFLSLPYLQECHPLDKNNATISKHKYRIVAC
jgi:hypothetical protein